MKQSSSALIVAIVAVLAGPRPGHAPPRRIRLCLHGIQGPFTVIKVVDGDTIWVGRQRAVASRSA